MPRRSGIEATMAIRAQLPRGRPQPYIVAMTAAAFAEDRARCINAGMVSCSESLSCRCQWHCASSFQLP